jgi:hypothetical protein
VGRVATPHHRPRRPPDPAPGSLSPDETNAIKQLITKIISVPDIKLGGRSLIEFESDNIGLYFHTSKDNSHINDEKKDNRRKCHLCFCDDVEPFILKGGLLGLSDKKVKQEIEESYKLDKSDRVKDLDLYYYVDHGTSEEEEEAAEEVFFNSIKQKVKDNGWDFKRLKDKDKGGVSVFNIISILLYAFHLYSISINLYRCLAMNFIMMH